VGYYPEYTVGPILWALTLSLMTFAGIWTVLAYHRRGLPGAIRGGGLVLLPISLLLTGILLLALRIVDAVTLWAARLVFNPTVWIGVVLLVVSIGLISAGGRMPRHGAESKLGWRRSAAAAPGPSAPGTDAELAEIEDMLRQRDAT
jgi:hypothetical protein